MSELELTVVVTTRNRGHLIGDTLAALRDQAWDGAWDVVVVDNGSTDDTPAIVRAALADLPVPARLIVAAERHNPSYSRNAGVAATTATSVAFVDDDDEITPGWVAAIGHALREHQFVGSRMDYLKLNGPQLGATTTFQTERLGKHFDAPIVDSAGSGCRRALWAAVGGSNESYRNGQDVDFSLRVARHGEVVPHFCADALYHARLRGSTRGAFSRGRRRGRSEVRLFREHGAAFGARPDPIWIAVGRWARLVVRLPHLAAAGRRVVWFEDAGRRVGRLGACIRDRTWYP